MPDSKYGGLYTEDDVKALVQEAMENDIESEDEFVEQILDKFEGRFGKDEPLFVIRGRDVAGPRAVRSYGAIAEEEGAGDPLLEGVAAAGEKFQSWQEANPELVKIPD